MRLGFLCTCLALAGMGTALGDDWGSQDQSKTKSQSDWNSQSGQSGSQTALQPQGWVAVAYDFDNDGQYDAFEYITAYDLDDLRSKSQRSQSGQSGQGGQQFRMTSDQGAQPKQLSGTINALYTKSKHGERCLIAEIETDQGQTVTADLGSPQELRDVNLQEGDYIRVNGHKVRMGDQSVLMAQRVNVQGQSFTVNQHQHGRMQQQMQGQGRQQQFTGEVLKTRTANFRNADQPHLLAYVEIDTGAVKTVNFGPKHEVQDSVQEGSTVTFTARHGRINGNPALIAQQVETPSGRMTQIDWSGSRQQSFQQERMQSAGWGQSPSSSDWQSSANY